MLSEQEKLSIIKTVTQSKTFQKATTSSALLKYLAKVDIEKAYLKEDIIDIEFFGKKGKSDKSNTRVRVSMYNLRKKLEDYYSEEGIDDQWKVIIDKGQYGLRFYKIEKNPKNKQQFINKHSIAYSILVLIIFGLIFNKLPSDAPSLWKDFIDSQLPTTLFIGDVIGMRGETITGSEGFTRDYSINTIDEYYSLLDKKPTLKEKLTLSNYQYFTAMGATATKNITLLLSKYNKPFDIKYNSNISIDDIKNCNAIYAGPLLNDTRFIDLFNDANPYMTISRKELLISNHPTINDTLLKVSTSGKLSDIAIVAKIPGPMGTEQFIFFSNHDMGVSATIEYFTNPDSIKHFNNKYLHGKKYFTAVYDAYGRERTSLDMELKMVIPF